MDIRERVKEILHDTDGDYHQATDAVMELIAEDKKCGWCGSNDLVCGKAWKEERDKLKAQIKSLEAELEKKSNSAQQRRIEGQQDIIKHLEATQKKYREALKLLDKMANQRFAWKRNSNEDDEGWLKVGDITSEALKENV